MNVIKDDSEGEAKGLRRTVVLRDYSPSFGLALLSSSSFVTPLAFLLLVVFLVLQFIQIIFSFVIVTYIN